jgi:hypothetical protein
VLRDGRGPCRAGSLRLRGFWVYVCCFPVRIWCFAIVSCWMRRWLPGRNSVVFKKIYGPGNLNNTICTSKSLELSLITCMGVRVEGTVYSTLYLKTLTIQHLHVRCLWMNQNECYAMSGIIMTMIEPFGTHKRLWAGLSHRCLCF